MDLNRKKIEKTTENRRVQNFYAVNSFCSFEGQSNAEILVETKVLLLGCLFFVSSTFFIDYERERLNRTTKSTTSKRIG